MKVRVQVGKNGHFNHGEDVELHPSMAVYRAFVLHNAVRITITHHDRSQLQYTISTAAILIDEDAKREKSLRRHPSTIKETDG